MQGAEQSAAAVASAAAQAAHAPAQVLSEPPRVSYPPFPPTRAASDENLVRLAMDAETAEEAGQAEPAALATAGVAAAAGSAHPRGAWRNQGAVAQEYDGEVDLPRQRAGIRVSAHARQADEHGGGTPWTLQDAMWAALEDDGMTADSNENDSSSLQQGQTPTGRHTSPFPALRCSHVCAPCMTVQSLRARAHAARTCTHMHTHAHTCTHMHTHAHTCTHTRRHTHTHSLTKVCFRTH